MTFENVKIRVRVGVNEVEVEAPISTLEKALSFIPSIVQQLPPSSEQIRHNTVGNAESSREEPLQSDGFSETEFPVIRVERDDALTDVIVKIFKEEWGQRPRRPKEVCDTLDSIGETYPKKQVGVALLRLARSGELRRIKSDKGRSREYVYIRSNSLAAETNNNENINLVVLPEPQLTGSR